MQQLLSSLEDERQRQFRRFVAFSAGAHVLLALLFWIGPVRFSSKRLPAVEQITIVEVVAPAAASKPAPPKPAPAKPAPPPPPPPPAKKVLPKQPAPLPKPKPEVKQKPKPEKKPEPAQKPPEPPAEESYEDLLERLRDEEGTQPPAPVEQAAARPGPTGPVGGPGILDPEVARWQREAKRHVTQAWVLAPGFRTERLEAEFEVDLSPTGEVLGVRKTASSGNPWFDESAERAIQKASPLPAPPEGGEWSFTFKPEDVL